MHMEWAWCSLLELEQALHHTKLLMERIMKVRLYANHKGYHHCSLCPHWGDRRWPPKITSMKFCRQWLMIRQSTISDWSLATSVQKVGSDNSHWSRVMGPHGVGIMNKGLRLVEYCAENDRSLLECYSTIKLLKKKKKKPPGYLWMAITIVRSTMCWSTGKWRKSLLDVQTYRGADIGSDHELVIAKIQP